MIDHSLLRHRRAVVVFLVLALLAACARGPSGKSDSPAGSDSAGPAGAVPPDTTATVIVALGNEPFWNVTVSADSIVWRTPDEIDGVRFPAVAPEQVEGRRVWRTSRSGRPSTLELAIMPRACSDGMSDRTYPFASEVVLDSALFTGCAEERTSKR